MGCVSSKLVKKEIKREILLNNGGDFVNHVVSLKSSTYGVLKLDNEQQQQGEEQVESQSQSQSERLPRREEPEVINAWELMEGLEEEGGFNKRLSPKSSSSSTTTRVSPLKFLNQFGASPLKVKRFGSGKENKGSSVNGKSEFSPKSILRDRNSLDGSMKASKAVLKLTYPVKSTRIPEGFDLQCGESGRRKSFSPLFDPELVALYEKELSEEGEQIKMIISPQPEIRKSKKSEAPANAILGFFEEKCPPGGENAVVIYTTTLRGIRKTFEECNTVRSIVESYHVQLIERDISMDSGFKEELRKLRGMKEVKVPLVFVKGRLIGGVEEIVELEEEGKLEKLLEGMPRQASLGSCEGCGGVRFVMCRECNGSCKVLDGELKKKMRCGECNENGLIHCPICC